MSTEIVSLSSHKIDDLSLDQSVSIDVVIKHEEIESFARLTTDYNPIHVDKSAANEQGFADQVVHGMLVTSYISTLVGMILPGKNSLIGSTQFNYLTPVFVGDQLTISGRISEKYSSLKSIVLDINIYRNIEPVVTGSVHVKVHR